MIDDKRELQLTTAHAVEALCLTCPRLRPRDQILLVLQDGRELYRSPCVYRPKVKSRSLTSKPIEQGLSAVEPKRSKRYHSVPKG